MFVHFIKYHDDACSQIETEEVSPGLGGGGETVVCLYLKAGNVCV